MDRALQAVAKAWHDRKEIRARYPAAKGAGGAYRLDADQILDVSVRRAYDSGASVTRIMQAAGATYRATFTDSLNRTKKETA